MRKDAAPPAPLPGPAPRRLAAGDALFALGDLAYAAVVACKAADLHAALEAAAHAAAGGDCAPIVCGIDGCRREFCTLLSYERHAGSEHAAHRCRVCGLGFMSERLAAMHAQEAHDALFALLAAKRPMFACLLAACPRRFRSARGRRLHMVDAHQFPRSFSFGSAPRPLAGGSGSGGVGGGAGGDDGGGVGGGGGDADDSGPSAPAAAVGTRHAPAATVGMALDDVHAPPARMQSPAKPPLVAAAACKFFASVRGCRHGAACRFHHGFASAGDAAAAACSAAATTDDADASMDALAGALASQLRVAVPDDICFGSRRGAGRRGGLHGRSAQR